MRPADENGNAPSAISYREVGKVKHADVEGTRSRILARWPSQVISLMVRLDGG